MVEHHGSQCGYCTPGIVVALTGLLESDPDPDDDALRTALTGNLCRCTGYLPILEAGRSFDRDRHRTLAELYPDPADGRGPGGARLRAAPGRGGLGAAGGSSSAPTGRPTPSRSRRSTPGPW